MSAQAPERIPPYSEEAEVGVVGSILVNSECLYDVRGSLRITPEMFYTPKCALVMQAIFDLADAGRVIDLITVQSWLTDKNQLDRAGGLSALMSIIDATPTSSHIRNYAEIVRQKWRLRVFTSIVREAMDGAFYDPDIDKVFSQTANKLHELAGDQLEIKRTNAQVFDEVMARWELAHERRMKGDQVPLIGLETPYGRLNEMLCGLQPGLHFIAAPPNAGKTCVEGQISEFVAMTAGPVLRIYLDDTHDDAIGRSASRIGGVSLSKLQHGFATRDDLAKIRDDVRPTIEAMPMYIHEDVETIEEVATLARLYKAKHGIVLLTVDYVQIVDIEEEKYAQQERDRLAIVCKKLKRLWKELKIPIVVLSQIGRESYKADSNPRKASMSELFGAAVLEHTATTVSILKQLKEDDVAPQPIDGDKYSFKLPVAWHLVKSKHGPKGMIPLWFYPKYFRFQNTLTHRKNGATLWMDWAEHIKSDRQRLDGGES